MHTGTEADVGERLLVLLSLRPEAVRIELSLILLAAAWQEERHFSTHQHNTELAMNTKSDTNICRATFNHVQTHQGGESTRLNESRNKDP